MVKYARPCQRYDTINKNTNEDIIIYLLQLLGESVCVLCIYTIKEAVMCCDRIRDHLDHEFCMPGIIMMQVIDIFRPCRRVWVT